MAAWVFVMGLTVFIVVVVLWLRFGKQCPKCGRAHAIDTTAREKRQPSFLERYLGEWKWNRRTPKTLNAVLRKDT